VNSTLFEEDASVSSSRNAVNVKQYYTNTQITPQEKKKKKKQEIKK
jgi:hypothetical protein